MNPVVTFVFSDWATAFPVFANVSQALAQSWFNRASFICANEATNPANCVPGMLQNLLYLLTAHIAWLNAPRDSSGQPISTGTPAPSTVGRVNTATEGSVSVGLDMGDANAGSPSQAWYMQTTWGAEYWYATAQFRTARYSALPTFVPGPVFPGVYPRFGRVY